MIGGSGNLGSFIVQALHENGAKVATFDLAPYAAGLPGVVSHVGDICDKAQLMGAMKGVEVVFHAASVIDIRPVPSPSMMAINVGGTQNAIECCRACNVKRLVYTSSLEVCSGYGPDGQAMNHIGRPEDDESLPIPVRHHIPYASTKAEAERRVLAANELPGKLRTVSLRIGYIVGPGCIGVRIDFLKIHKGGGRYITAQMPSKISCVHPQNAAQAHLLSAERADNAEVGGNAFFISDFEANTTDVSVAAAKGISAVIYMLPMWLAYIVAFVMHACTLLILQVCRGLGIPFEIPQEVVDKNALQMAWRNICFSGKKAERVLGYGPGMPRFVTQEESLRQTVAWAQEFYASLQKEASSKVNGKRRPSVTSLGSQGRP